MLAPWLDSGPSGLPDVEAALSAVSITARMRCWGNCEASLLSEGGLSATEVPAVKHVCQQECQGRLIFSFLVLSEVGMP